MTRPRPTEDHHPEPAAANRRRRPIRVILVFVLAAYAAWIVFQVVSFKRYVTPPEIVRAEILTPGSAVIQGRTGPPEPVELRGAYHLHTRHSDGAKTVAEVAAAAERAGLDFVILTDHGAPNLPSLESQGKIGRVLVIAGTEISSSRGHLVALGFNRPSRLSPRMPTWRSARSDRSGVLPSSPTPIPKRAGPGASKRNSTGSRS